MASMEATLEVEKKEEDRKKYAVIDTETGSVIDYASTLVGAATSCETSKRHYKACGWDATVLGVYKKVSVVGQERRT